MCSVVNNIPFYNPNERVIHLRTVSIWVKALSKGRFSEIKKLCLETEIKYKICEFCRQKIKMYLFLHTPQDNDDTGKPSLKTTSIFTGSVEGRWVPYEERSDSRWDFY